MVENINCLRKRIWTAEKNNKEISNGYIFSFSDNSILSDLRLFVNHERECCTFLNFEINKDTPQITCKVTLNNDNLSIINVKEIIITLFSDD